MHLVGFIIRIYHDARSPERLTDNMCFTEWLKTEKYMGVIC